EAFFNYKTGTPHYILTTDSQSINNANFVGNAINPVTYSGIRVSALYKINDDWDVLLTQSYQNMNAQGVFYQMPTGPEGIFFNKVGEPQGGRPLPPFWGAVFTDNFDRE